MDDAAELEKRFVIFADNLKYIQEHNRKAVAGEKTYRLGLNSLADLSIDEFQSRFLGKKLSSDASSTSQSFKRLAADRLVFFFFSTTLSLYISIH